MEEAVTYLVRIQLGGLERGSTSIEANEVERLEEAAANGENNEDMVSTIHTTDTNVQNFEVRDIHSCPPSQAHA